ncbi:MAG: hypothetical protein KKB59_20240 [Spirochaetes bacterium]|nr:hypothetical protein [Spirochaetota bacterium]
MTIEECYEKAKLNLDQGKVNNLRVSFICFRKNELMATGIDDSSAMKQANEDWENYR